VPRNDERDRDRGRRRLQKPSPIRLGPAHTFLLDG
jgi:hypothetical protein